MMDFSVAVPVIVSFVISAAAGPVIIPLLRKLKVGQTVRDDGPQSHLKKNGTPTMGGLIFLLGVVVTSLFYMKDYPKIIPILFVTVGFGIVGFLDDYIKVVLHRSEGLTPGQKMAGQILVTGIFVYGVLHGSWSADVDPVQRRQVSGCRCAFGSAFIFCSDWDCEWHEFYGWFGWACFQCDGYGGCILHRGGDRNGQRDCACDGGGDRRPFGIPFV